MQSVKNKIISLRDTLYATITKYKTEASKLRPEEIQEIVALG